jgi:hypothetical protein
MVRVVWTSCALHRFSLSDFNINAGFSVVASTHRFEIGTLCASIVESAAYIDGFIVNLEHRLRAPKCAESKASPVPATEIFR